jgi:hypothetical protein
MVIRAWVVVRPPAVVTTGCGARVSAEMVPDRASGLPAPDAGRENLTRASASGFQALKAPAA